MEPTPPASNTQPSGMSSWARNLKSLGLGASQQNSQVENTGGMSAFARLTGGMGLGMPSSNEAAPGSSGADQPNLIESFTKGLVDSSKTAVKAVQTKARHIVSQNKRRYQVR